MAEAQAPQGDADAAAGAGGAAGAEAVEESEVTFRNADLLDQLKEPEQQQRLREMMELFRGPEETEQEDGRGLYHDAGCLLRYLRARKWDLQAAQTMLRNTGRWRRSFNFAGLIAGEYAESMASENDSGKMYVRGYDRRGRPALYMKPRNENSSDNEGMVRHLVYCVERAVRCIERQTVEGRLGYERVDPQAGKFVLCVDFADYGLSNLIPLSVARAVIGVLQDQYPERLGQAFIIDAPWILNAFITAVTPFVDPVTLEKVQFIMEDGEARAARMAKTFDLSVLEPEFGGTATTPFESHIFLNSRLDGTAFGLEFNEQARLFEQEAAEARLKALQEGGYCLPNGGFTDQFCRIPTLQVAAFWGVSSDKRVLQLPRKERGLVRELARKLACETDDTVEEHDGLFNDAGAIIRYLRWQAWDPPRAERKIRATARWRKEFGLAAQRDGMFSEAIARENAVGNMYVRGFDRRGRPIIYVKLGGRDLRQRKDALRHFVYCLERAIACLEPRPGAPATPAAPAARFDPAAAEVEDALPADPEGRFTVLVDFAGYACRHRPKLKTVREALTILQEHYPERLGEAYLLRPPLRVRAAWRLARRRFDPALYHKVVAVRSAKQLSELADAVFVRAMLEVGVGGEVDTSFDSQVFLYRRVNGEVYGSEFDAQHSAACSERNSPRKVSWAQDLFRKDAVEESGSGWSLLSCFFGSP